MSAAPPPDPDETLTETRTEHFQLALTTGQPQTWEEVRRGSGGRPQVLRQTYAPVFGAGGTLRCVLHYGADITVPFERARQIGLLERVMLASHDPLMVLGAQPGESYLRLVYANLAFERLHLNLTLESLIGTTPAEWGFGPEDRTLIAGLLEQLQRQGSLHCELWLPDRQEWVEFKGDPLLEEDGRLSYWAVHTRNITARKQAEVLRQGRIQSSTLSLQGRPLPEVLPPILSGLQQWARTWQVAVVYGFDTALKLVGTVSQQFTAFLEGFSAAQGRALWQERDPDHSGAPLINPDLWADPRLAAHRQMLRESGLRATTEVPLYGQHSELIGVLLMGHGDLQYPGADLITVLSEEARAVGLLLEQDRQRRRLERLAYQDALTELPNRLAFLSGVEALIRRRPQQPFALAILNLNRFKQINEGLGHSVGDALLRRFTALLGELAASCDIEQLARLGGDEFALVLNDLEQISQINALVANFGRLPVLLDGRAVRSSAAIGWSLFPSSAADTPSLMRQADTALYVAKRTQQTAHLYTLGSQPRHSRPGLEQAIYEALDSEQFRLVYQPQVLLSDQSITGAEALLRWTHPLLGVISPVEFIPVAEETGLIRTLGGWALRRACKDAAAWPDQTLKISVNLSAVQLAQVSLVGDVLEALSGSGLHPERLILEVTETALMSDLFLTQQSLRSLRGLGVRISIDDFGTGYSSLATLHGLQVDELKIDRMFVQELADLTADQPSSRAIVQSTVALAHALGLVVVAEGVETPGQAEFLQRSGCDLMQGWLVAGGLEQSEFVERFTRK